MKLGLINSAWAQAGKGTDWGIRQTKVVGFDTIDIFADPLDTDAKERKLIRVECERVAGRASHRSHRGHRGHREARDPYGTSANVPLSVASVSSVAMPVALIGNRSGA